MLNKSVLLNIILIIFLISNPIFSFSQEFAPNKKISICEGYISPENALQIIEKKENITFSYNPQVFNLSKEIYLCKRNASLQEVVSIIMNTNTELIIENRHVIIKPGKIDNAVQKKQKYYKFSGTIENSVNGMPIDSCIIQINGQVYYSNENGYFNFFLMPKADSSTIYFEKDNYIGYKSNVQCNKDNTLRILLNPEIEIDYTYLPSTVKDKNSTIENHWITNIVVSNNQTDLSKSRKTLIDKEMQFSVIPNIGTYFNESGLCRFKRSYNILAGYVGEIYGYELGLGVNIIRYDLTGFQFSGIANIVGGEVSGFQTGTGANIVIGNFRGAQVSAASNTTWGKFFGFQATAGVNLVRSKFRGFQLAPVNIVADTLLGIQLGAVNIVSKPACGAQISILMNYAPTNNSLQYSTFLNTCKINNAPQLGIINTAIEQNNLQLGLFNFADTVQGIPIGFLSFVKNGYTYLDYSLNLDLFSSLKFKTGTWKFYNIINAAVRPDKEPDFAIGYGFGSYFIIWKMFGINYDLYASHVFENNTFNTNLNILTQFDLNLNFSIAKHFTIYAGGQLNAMFTSNLANDAIHNESTIPPTKVLFDSQYSHHRAYLWPSFHIGFRI
ncbi:MAG TPA: hypothetical protein PKN32_09615 [Bacteroidales bacterium]|nr:hypothetical protein [Bacteroidales bacterium]